MNRLVRVFGSALKGVSLFLPLGPPIGGQLILLLSLLADLAGGKGMATPENILAGVMMYAIGSYFFGAIPAAATGILAGVLRDSGYLHSLGDCFYLAGLGCGIAVAFGFWQIQIIGDSPSGVAALMYGMPAFVASLCCALLFRRRPNDAAPRGPSRLSSRKAANPFTSCGSAHENK